ncbi:unnamed protein product [Peronospora destructor]|uniref:Uncharacterized protein n=1 Tax=Peronospora destructor TaxID=86335 RepID=A0AAV0SWF1_9STRA|nr:unnamed protein product [Peronospora destructor]CAI5709258.1 unnamed protein product [Peronospora destructor]
MLLRKVKQADETFDPSITKLKRQESTAQVAAAQTVEAAVWTQLPILTYSLARLCTIIESEVAETLMSLSAPDERKFTDNPLYAAEPPSSCKPARNAPLQPEMQALSTRCLPQTIFSRTLSHTARHFAPAAQDPGRPLTSRFPAGTSSSDVDMEPVSTSLRLKSVIIQRRLSQLHILLARAICRLHLRAEFQE